MKLYGVELTIRPGDITETAVDAIVNAANSFLTMGGGVAGAIRRKGGHSIEEEAVKMAPIPIGRAIVTRAGRLPAKRVIHAPTMSTPGPTTAANVYLATRAALEAAKELQAKSLAIPGMGTGVGGVAPDDAAEAMFRAITDHLAHGSKLSTLILTDVDRAVVAAFERQLSQFSETSGTKRLSRKKP